MNGPPCWPFMEENGTMSSICDNLQWLENAFF